MTTMAITATAHATPLAMATSFPLPWKEASVFAEASTEEAERGERGEDSWDWEGQLKIVSDSIRIIEPETSTVCGTVVVIDWTSRLVMVLVEDTSRLSLRASVMIGKGCMGEYDPWEGNP